MDTIICCNLFNLFHSEYKYYQTFFLCFRAEVYSSLAADDHPRRSAVSERVEDEQQHQVVSTSLSPSLRLVHGRRIHPSGKSCMSN